MLPKGLLKEHSQFLSLILRAVDIIALLAAGLITNFLKFGQFYLPPHYLIALGIAVGLALIIFPFFHIYESVRIKSFWQHTYNLIQAVLTIAILLAGLAFLTKTGEHFSRVWFSGWMGCSLGLLILFRCSLIILLRLMRAQGWNEKRVIIMGAGELGIKLAETVQQALWTGFRVVTIFDEQHSLARRELNGIAITETPKDLSVYLANTIEPIEEIWIALPLSAEERVKAILHALRHETMAIRFVLDFFGMNLLNHSLTYLAGFPVINICSSPMRGVNRIIKALEDRLLAIFILLLVSPLFLFIALAVKWSSPGPILYRQKRVSWNGKEFEMLKFRTMPVDAEMNSGPVWAKKEENRSTKIGAFLRKTSLDELPQFINVLRGEMSIVGPRPERMVFVEQFKHQVPRYMHKHLVKAGITGWAQVNGWRGNTSLEKRIEYDLFYIENWSLLFDLKIIFLTLLKGFMNKNAY